MIDKIIEFASRRFIMWAEPDEGSYNWKLYDICSRYDRDFKIPDDISEEIKEYIRKNASKYYPVAIIDGFHLDTILDIRDDTSSDIKYITL